MANNPMDNLWRRLEENLRLRISTQAALEPPRTPPIYDDKIAVEIDTIMKGALK